mmetsp:Transcript_26875/g.65317  ORF Transcript_26875/g.65317 Transcript_26875/m.65317 type:complete len:92 (-) Transcript_26875:1817-2092(-)
MCITTRPQTMQYWYFPAAVRHVLGKSNELVNDPANISCYQEYLFLTPAVAGYKVHSPALLKDAFMNVLRPSQVGSRWTASNTSRNPGPVDM